MPVTDLIFDYYRNVLFVRSKLKIFFIQTVFPEKFEMIDFKKS